MGNKLIKTACCYRLKKLANAASYIQRSRTMEKEAGIPWRSLASGAWNLGKRLLGRFGGRAAKGPGPNVSVIPKRPLQITGPQAQAPKMLPKPEIHQQMIPAESRQWVSPGTGLPAIRGGGGGWSGATGGWSGKYHTIPMYRGMGGTYRNGNMLQRAARRAQSWMGRHPGLTGLLGGAAGYMGARYLDHGGKATPAGVGVPQVMQGANPGVTGVVSPYVAGTQQAQSEQYQPQAPVESQAPGYGSNVNENMSAQTDQYANGAADDEAGSLGWMRDFQMPSSDDSEMGGWGSEVDNFDLANTEAPGYSEGNYDTFESSFDGSDYDPSNNPFSDSYVGDEEVVESQPVAPVEQPTVRSETALGTAKPKSRRKVKKVGPTSTEKSVVYPAAEKQPVQAPVEAPPQVPVQPTVPPPSSVSAPSQAYNSTQGGGTPSNYQNPGAPYFNPPLRQFMRNMFPGAAARADARRARRRGGRGM